MAEAHRDAMSLAVVGFDMETSRRQCAGMEDEVLLHRFALCRSVTAQKTANRHVRVGVSEFKWQETHGRDC